MTIAPAERVETSLEEIAALDFEPELPCVWPEHGRRATWRISMPCGHAWLACDFCRECFKSDPSLFTSCSACKLVTFAFLVRFEPLR